MRLIILPLCNMCRLLFWSDWGTPAKIERASMDGTHQQTLFNTELIWPNALSIDRKNQVLYWADASLDKIESSKIDGSNRRVLLRDGILHPFSIVAFNNTLYWSDWQADTIFTSRLIGTRLTNSTSLLRRLSAEPMTVQVISEEVQIARKSQQTFSLLFLRFHLKMSITLVLQSPSYDSQII